MLKIYYDLMNSTAERAITLPPYIPIETPLADRLALALSRMKGAREHEQIIRLLHNAKAYKIENETVTAIAESLSKSPFRTEMNADKMLLEDESIWIEFKDIARRHPDVEARKSTKLPVNIGYLIAQDENNPDRMIIVNAWDFPDESVRYSYAIASVDLNEISIMAHNARKLSHTTKQESLRRMMEITNFNIPKGLEKEIITTEKIDNKNDWETTSEEIKNNAIIDISSEIPFLFTTLIAMGSDQAVMTEDRDKRFMKFSHVFKKQMPIKFMRKRGFIRCGSRRNPSVTWFNP